MRWRARSAVTSFARGREGNLDLRSRAGHLITVDAHKRQRADSATAAGVLAAEGCHCCCRRPGVIRVICCGMAMSDAEGMLNCYYMTASTLSDFHLSSHKFDGHKETGQEYRR